MKDTLVTIATGATGVTASAVSDTIIKSQPIIDNLTSPEHVSMYVQLLIGFFTFASLVIQTFFKKKVNNEE